MCYWPFNISCLRDRPLVVHQTLTVLHSFILRAEHSTRSRIFWRTSWDTRSITSLDFNRVQISFSLGLIVLVRSFTHMYDSLPKAIHSFDMNESNWQIEGTCSYRYYMAMTSSVFTTQLMKTEWWAAADRISEYKWWAWLHEAHSVHSSEMNNDVTVAYVKAMFLPSIFVAALNGV